MFFFFPFVTLCGFLGALGVKISTPLKIFSNMEVPALAALTEKVFDNLYFRKLYHLLGGGLMVTGLLLLDRSWFFLVSAICVLAFWVYGRQVSFAVIGVIPLIILSGSRSSALLQFSLHSSPYCDKLC